MLAAGWYLLLLACMTVSAVGADAPCCGVVVRRWGGGGKAPAEHLLPQGLSQQQLLSPPWLPGPAWCGSAPALTPSHLHGFESKDEVSFCHVFPLRSPLKGRGARLGGSQRGDWNWGGFFFLLSQRFFLKGDPIPTPILSELLLETLVNGSK